MSIKKVVLPGLLSLLLALLAGYISLILYQNLIIFIQNLDYQLYQASRAPEQLISQLQEQGNLTQKPKAIKTNTLNNQNKLYGPILPSSISQNKAILSPTATPTTPKRKTKKTNTASKSTKVPWIVIPKIGVSTQILTTGSLKKRMYKGVAIINAFGRPNSNNKVHHKPTILVSHRFGYVWWTPAYRRTHSFHNIDKLKPGDVIFIRWNSKWYKYKIIKTEVSATISSYDYDLILYSCINYTSKQRIIIYANLVK